MSENAPEQFYGDLLRAEFEAGRAVLRFYQFAFDANATEPPVYEVTFLQPAFGYNDIKPFIDQEVEFSTAGDSALLCGVFGGDEHVLLASSIAPKWQSYDLDDYVARVKHLDALYIKMHSDLRNARSRLDKVTSTVTELLRRAEIKAAASPELQKIQSAAIEVLNRILFELE